MAKPKEELEIKLVGAPADVEALRRSPIVKSLMTGEGAWERLVSTYYDTPEGVLQKRGVSLRLREEAGERIQTIKITRKIGGVLSRLEDERVLAASDQVPIITRNAPGAEEISDAENLQAAARTVSDRWSVELKKDRTRIEAAFDLGRVEAWRDGAPFRSGPLAEAELELLKGKSAVLFKVARRILKESDGRLRLGVRSKGAQARHCGEAATPILSEKNLSFAPDDKAGDVFAAALMASAVRIIDLTPIITDQRLPEGVHQMRVALRRLRAIERAFRKAADDGVTRDLARRARRFARVLGPARDWDVFFDTTLAAITTGDYAAGDFAALETHAGAMRAAAWTRAARLIGSPKFNRFALDLLEAAYRRPWQAAGNPALAAPVRTFARAALDEKYKIAASAAVSLAPSDLAARHPLRIAMKRLRYTAQTFRSLYLREARKPFMAAMSRLQDELGMVNDAIVAQQLADEAAIGQGRRAARAAGFISGYEAAAANAAAKKAGESWAAFQEIAPFWR